VRFYNYARISDRELRIAENVVARSLSQAGIQLEWTGCPTNQGTPGDTPAPCASIRSTDVVLYFVGTLKGRSKEKGVDDSALGYALLPGGNQTATVAYVSYQRVQNLSAYMIVDEAELLGLAVAHEIGHLLLGPHSHTHQGIMRGDWRFSDIEHRGWELHFTS